MKGDLNVECENEKVIKRNYHFEVCLKAFKQLIEEIQKLFL